MEINFSKKTILSLVAFIWIVFSVVYIVWGIWTDFKEKEMIAAYDQGRIDTINILISETEKCEPISVAGSEKETKVIGVHCLTENIDS